MVGWLKHDSDKALNVAVKTSQKHTFGPSLITWPLYRTTKLTWVRCNLMLSCCSMLTVPQSVLIFFHHQQLLSCKAMWVYSPMIVPTTSCENLPWSTCKPIEYIRNACSIWQMHSISEGSSCTSVYQQLLHFQGYDDFQMAATSHNGQVMIQKCSWRSVTHTAIN